MITELITGFFLSSVEIYVFAAVLAAGVVAFFVRPSERGEAREHLLAGVLAQIDGPAAEVASLRIECLAGGDLLLTRCGLPEMTDDGACSLAISIIGFDITIEERLVRGSASGEPVNAALFTLDFLGQERYHVRYNSEPTASAVAFTLSNREGISLVKELKINS